MLVKVKKDFIDRHTHELHPMGAVFSVSEERMNEIKNVGDFIEVIEEEVTSIEKTKRTVRRKKAGAE